MVSMKDGLRMLTIPKASSCMHNVFVKAAEGSLLACYDKVVQNGMGPLWEPHRETCHAKDTTESYH